jgi:hypothetical protein
MVEGRVRERVLLEVVQQGDGLSVLDLPLSPSPQGPLTVCKIRCRNHGIGELERDWARLGVVVARLE